MMRARTILGGLGLVAAWAFVVTAAIDTGLPASPLRPLGQPSLAARSLAPQGWGFFTRDPHEPPLLVYRRDPDGWRDASFGPNAEPHQLFGWRRSARAQGVESGALLFAHGKLDFVACDADLGTCLEHGEVIDRVDNPTPDPTLCGDIALVKRRVIPWAWARTMARDRAPAEILRLEVSC